MSNIEAFYSQELCEIFKKNENEDYLLADDEQKHLKVKRYKLNDKILLLDGSGSYSVAKIVSINPYKVSFSNISYEETEDMHITLVLALLKGKAFDDAIKMAVELGVNKVIPWQASRSIVKWNNPDKEHSSLEKLVLESVKQCRRKWLPEVKQIIKSKEFAEVCSKNTIVLYENSKMPISEILQKNKEDFSTDSITNNYTIIIGPEGGITDEEIELLKKSDVKYFASLGDTILRAPTAVAKAITILTNK